MHAPPGGWAGHSRHGNRSTCAQPAPAAAPLPIPVTKSVQTCYLPPLQLFTSVRHISRTATGGRRHWPPGAGCRHAFCHPTFSHPRSLCLPACRCGDLLHYHQSPSWRRSRCGCLIAVLGCRLQAAAAARCKLRAGAAGAGSGPLTASPQSCACTASARNEKQQQQQQQPVSLECVPSASRAGCEWQLASAAMQATANAPPSRHTSLRGTHPSRQLAPPNSPPCCSTPRGCRQWSAPSAGQARAQSNPA